MTGTTTETVSEAVIEHNLHGLMREALDRRIKLDRAIDQNIKAVAALDAAGLSDAEALIAAMAMVREGRLADVAKPLLDRLIALELITVTVRL
jgi:hypothetical protein